MRLVSARPVLLVMLVLASCSSGEGVDGGALEDASPEDSFTPDAPEADAQSAGPDAMIEADAEPRDAGGRDAGFASSDGACVGAAGSRSISGREINTWVTAGGDITAPFQERPLHAFMFSGDEGCYAEYPIARDPAGTFSVTGLPAGATYLEYHPAPRFVVTPGTDIDLGFWVLGRRDVVAPSAGTTLELDLEGLAPWGEGDNLQIFVPNTGTWAYGVANPGDVGTPTVTATVARGVALDLGAFNVVDAALIDSAAGDVAYVAQHSRQGDYRAAVRFGALDAFTMTDGQVTSAHGVLTAPTESRSVTIEWRRSAFAALAPSLNPRATEFQPMHDLYVSATPHAERGGFGASLDLLSWSPGDSADETATLTYVDPRPGELGTFMAASTTYAVDIAVGRSAPTTFFVASSLWTSSGPGPIVIEPFIGPVRSPRIEGRDLFAGQQSGVGLTPRLSWDPPSFGTAQWYQVVLVRLASTQGQTTRTTVGRFWTREPELRLPPGILAAQAPYVALIDAIGGEPGLLDSTLPSGTTSILTTIFIP